MTVIKVRADIALGPRARPRGGPRLSNKRESIFPAVFVTRMGVHELEQTSAVVTEGTRTGPIVNWERCRYHWSTPDRVIATVIDSNVYPSSGSRWEITATPTAAAASSR